VWTTKDASVGAAACTAEMSSTIIVGANARGSETGRASLVGAMGTRTSLSTSGRVSTSWSDGGRNVAVRWTPGGRNVGVRETDFRVPSPTGELRDETSRPTRIPTATQAEI
jgi:hypothetical protein